MLIFLLARELTIGCVACRARAGKLNSNGSELLVFGKQYGKVFIGVQPTFGYEGDPMRLLFSRSASPHHGFAAYYTYLEKIFKARGAPACSAGDRHSVSLDRVLLGFQGL